MLDVAAATASRKTLDDGRVLAEQMREIGARAGPGGDVPADRHGPAARPRGRQRARGRRGAGHDPGDGPADFTELVLEACARLLAYRTSGSTPPRVAGGLRPPSPTAAPSSGTSGGFAPRAVTFGPVRARACPRAPGGARPARRRRHADRSARRRERGAGARRRPLHEGGFGRTRRRILLRGEARRHRGHGERPRHVHARDDASAEHAPSRPCWQRTRSV